MSLKQADFSNIVKQQYLFKLKTKVDIALQMVGIQLLAIVFSLFGASSGGSYSETLSVRAQFYSADLVIAFTMMWGFVLAITITTKQYRYYDFAFVTNRLTSNLANIYYIATMSIVGGITALLSRNLILFISNKFSNVHMFGELLTFKQLLLGIFATTLYIFLISSLGYLIGALIQVSKVFIVVIPALIIGSIYLSQSFQTMPIIWKIFLFFSAEKSFILFTFKCVVTTALLFIVSILIFNRMEVRN